ncbi:hypothetical protein [Thiofilum flexile]|uniref:hypothetical protein n=1 Tax=Thiofilum flexile TaxID=125627 RepID=UPI00036414DE|nr:hypothetical protein [Thiofilum flexile]
MQKVVSLHHNTAFKKIFSDPIIFTAFIKAVLGIDLNIDQVERDKPLSLSIEPNETYFDLFAENQTPPIQVYLRHVPDFERYQPFVLDHCAVQLEQCEKKRGTYPRLQVLTIVVITGETPQQVDELITDFDPKDWDGKPLGEIPHKIVFLCPRYVNEDTPAAYREWLRLIEDSFDGKVDATQYLDSDLQPVLAKIRMDI